MSTDIKRRAESKRDPGRTHKAVVKGTPFAQCTALFVGTGGNVKVKDEMGNTATYKNLPDAYVLDLQAVEIVDDADTTAADFIAWY